MSISFFFFRNFFATISSFILFSYSMPVPSLSARSEAKTSKPSRRGAQSKDDSRTAAANESSRENQPFDMQDLKDQVRRLRASKDEVERECEEIEAKNLTLESELQRLQRDRVALGDSVDAKQLVEPPSSADSYTKGTDGNAAFNKDFVEANMKLELTLLTAELKRILPSLEQDALRWEKMANAAEKERNGDDAGIVTRIPQVFLKHPDELKAELQKSSENIEGARKALKDNEREAMARLLATRSVVRKLRDEFNELAEDNTVQRMAVSTFQRMAAADLVAADLLLNDLLRLRSQICGQAVSKDSPSKVWTRYAFSTYTGTQLALI